MLKYKLPELPYAYDALAPVISEEIMTLHHSKHHAAYVDGANAALEKLAVARKESSPIDTKAVMNDLSFNLNGHILHTIFWMNLRPRVEGNKPSEKVEKLLIESFGSLEAFKNEFSNAAKSVQGSGWAVLSANINNNLVVHQLEKHNLLGLATFDPILVLDVWEHAYYVDYKNNRGAYVEAFWDIVNWDDIEMRLLGGEVEGCENCKDPENCHCK